MKSFLILCLFSPPSFAQQIEKCGDIQCYYNEKEKQRLLERDQERQEQEAFHAQELQIQKQQLEETKAQNEMLQEELDRSEAQEQSNVTTPMED